MAFTDTLRTMPNFQVQAILKTTSNLPEDWVTNTWSCIADDDIAAEGFIAEVFNFYNAIRGSFSNLVTLGGHQFKAYRYADPPPRAPFFESTWALATTPTGAPLPTEVACCLSFEGVQASGQIQARRRGRVFIGPLATSVMGADGRPTTSSITNLGAAAKDLFDAGLLAGDWRWSVFSRANNSGIPVDAGWVDNEFDTQRRRGRKATSRVVWLTV
jgi:hypothetical protein